MRSWPLFLAIAGISNAACPYMTGEMPAGSASSPHQRQDNNNAGGNNAKAETENFLSQFYVNDNGTFMTTDVGGPIEEQNSLRIGERGPTLLEDFIFRQKIQHFDHERVSMVGGLQWFVEPSTN